VLSILLWWCLPSLVKKSILFISNHIISLLASCQKTEIDVGNVHCTIQWKGSPLVTFFHNTIYCSFIYVCWCPFSWIDRNLDVCWHVNLWLWYWQMTSFVIIYLSLCIEFCGLVEQMKTIKIRIQRIKLNSQQLK
jgi:hypothetical protein